MEELFQHLGSEARTTVDQLKDRYSLLFLFATYFSFVAGLFETQRFLRALGQTRGVYTPVWVNLVTVIVAIGTVVQYAVPLILGFRAGWLVGIVFLFGSILALMIYTLLFSRTDQLVSMVTKTIALPMGAWSMHWASWGQL